MRLDDQDRKDLLKAVEKSLTTPENAEEESRLKVLKGRLTSPTRGRPEAMDIERMSDLYYGSKAKEGRAAVAVPLPPKVVSHEVPEEPPDVPIL